MYSDNFPPPSTSNRTQSSMSLSPVPSHEETGSSGSTLVRPIDVVVATYDYVPSRKSQLRLTQGDTVYVLSKQDSGWWDGITLDSNNKASRGWFPCNYSKSIRDRWFSLNKKNSLTSFSNNSSRRNSFALSTASLRGSLNTAGNNTRTNMSTDIALSPTLSNSSHLKQDYKLDMRRKSLTSRRPSTPSTECSSSSRLQQHVDPLQKLSLEEEEEESVTEPRGPVDPNKLNILTVQEIEMFFNNLHKNSPPLWTPVPTTHKKILYYNKEFNIYCPSLPLLHSPELNSESIFPDDDHLVDLRPRDLQLATDENIQVVDTGNLNSTPDVSSVSNADRYTRDQNRTNQRSSTSTTSSGMVVVSSVNANLAREDPNPNPNLQGRAKEAERRKEAETDRGNGTKREKSTEKVKENTRDNEAKDNDSEGDSSGWAQHPYETMYARQDLFYHHHMDIRSWTEFRNSTLHYINLAQEHFFKNNQHEFNTSFTMATRLIAFHQLGCRLLKHEMVKRNLRREARRLLKKLITSMARIGVNSNLFFCSPQRISLINQLAASRQSDPRDSKVSITSTNTTIPDPSRSSTSTIPSFLNQESPARPIRNFSSSTTDTLMFSEDWQSNGPNLESPQEIPSTRTSVPSLNAPLSFSVIDDESGILVQSLFQVIDTEFFRFKKNVVKLHDLMQAHFGQGDLPQLFPRFFKGHFSGGAWTNPFHQGYEYGSAQNSDSSPVFDSNQQQTNDSLGNRSYSVPSKDHTSFRGFSVSSKATSTASSSNAKHSVTGKPSHTRTFSRAKIMKRNRYPLNGDTLNLLKKKFNFIIINYYGNGHRLIDQPKSKKRNLELSADAYKALNYIVDTIEVLENLDLTFFVNLRNMSHDEKLDRESEELRKHAMTSLASTLMEFFEIKQALHDIAIRQIMDVQGLTLDDPFVFCAIRDESVCYFDREDELSKYQFLKQEKFAEELRNLLVSQDVEYNDLAFLDADQLVREASAKFSDIGNMMLQNVEQLIEERENILNYAARMMKSDLTAALMKGEQEKWFEDEDFDMASSAEGNENLDFADAQNKSFSRDIPWYLDSEHEYSLIYDNKGNIKGGTKEALLEHLTSHQSIDLSFNLAMLLTFRSIFTTGEFLQALVERYNLYPPEGLSYEEYNIWVEKKQKPVKIRVVNIMKTLFSHYWTPSYYEPGLDYMIGFAQLTKSQKISGADILLSAIKGRLSMKGNLKNFVPESINFSDDGSSTTTVPQSTRSSVSAPVGSSSTTGFRMRKLKLLDIDSLDYAKQLTIKEHSLFYKISPFECLDRTWGNKYCNMGGSKNITEFISNSNHLTNYVSFMIVKQTDIKKRIQLIQFFINVAAHCHELNNFSSLTAIISALYSSPIYRLKRTWAAVPEEYKKLLEELNTLMDSAKNFIRYRQLLKSIGDFPCVPFFGVYLSDLTFTANGNPDFLHRNTVLVNFGKRVRILEILKEISVYQRSHYKLKRYEDIQVFIESSLENLPSIEKQYAQSLRNEPRTEVSTGLNSTNVNYRYNTKNGSENKNTGKRLKFGKAKKQSANLLSQ